MLAQYEYLLFILLKKSTYLLFLLLLKKEYLFTSSTYLIKKISILS